jgi:hypothetical protein
VYGRAPWNVLKKSVRGTCRFFEAREKFRRDGKWVFPDSAETNEQTLSRHEVTHLTNAEIRVVE